MADIVPYNDNQFLETRAHFTSERGVSIDALIAAWLHAKEQRSHSAKTQQAYREAIGAFRDILREHGLDLIWQGENFVPTIADFAQAFASMRSEHSRRRGPVSPATQNQRLAVLSSFYLYAIKRQHLKTGNPIDAVDRPKVQAYAQAQAIEHDELRARLDEIDPRTKQGARDLALLTVLLSTGRRVSEVASLRRKHLHLSGKTIKITFEHTKGGEVMRDTLSVAVSKILLNWLNLLYEGQALKDVPDDAAIWVNVHHESRYGQPLGYHGVAGVCLHYLGTSKVHTTRHSFAVVMEVAGAKLTDIQKRLGHKNPATTGVYMAQLTQDRNPYADKV